MAVLTLPGNVFAVLPVSELNRPVSGVERRRNEVAAGSRSESGFGWRRQSARWRGVGAEVQPRRHEKRNRSAPPGTR